MFKELREEVQNIWEQYRRLPAAIDLLRQQVNTLQEHVSAIRMEVDDDYRQSTPTMQWSPPPGVEAGNVLVYRTKPGHAPRAKPKPKKKGGGRGKRA